MQQPKLSQRAGRESGSIPLTTPVLGAGVVGCDAQVAAVQLQAAKGEEGKGGEGTVGECMLKESSVDGSVRQHATSCSVPQLAE